MITPPKLRNDCFALPPGVDWVPLDDALARLKDRVTAVTGTEIVPVDQAAGRVLAEAVVARRANPPAANSAVDGYGFAGPVAAGPIELPLHPGRAAAGAPFDGSVPLGHAIRILTGAVLPPGVETVVLQEDVARDGMRIGFHGPLKAGANTRKAGEDKAEGAALFDPGRTLRPEDLALLCATGQTDVRVRKRLRVGVLSTGDEVVPAGDRPAAIQAHQIHDANRPMLLSLLRRWGMAAVDLGHVRDDRDDLRTRLDGARGQVDAVVTSGGVSTGDEDHVSGLLRDEGLLETWRIAVKPGRPLALGLWGDLPVFGLPGNPVAAFVCTLVFARPALGALSGAAWSMPPGFLLPAGFTKSKKPGRREYLRARVQDSGRVEVFASEGSGRISGLSWADGLVELGDGAAEITPGTLVRYIPYFAFD